jgi:hypothetical protein
VTAMLTEVKGQASSVKQQATSNKRLTNKDYRIIKDYEKNKKQTQ